MKGYLIRKVYLPIVAFLKQGVTPKKLALSVAFGCVLGVIPLLGATTVLCALASFSFRLNMGVIQIVNYAVYPLQLLFFIPFINVGVYLFNAEPLPFNIDQITDMLKENMFDLILSLGYFNVLGVVMWLLLAPLLLLILYYSGFWIFSKAQLPSG